jgi:hypothetical protein
MLELFRILAVPREFTIERLQSVSHSFGTSTDYENGTCTWFHFLCKNIELTDGLNNTPNVLKTPAKSGNHPATLDQADYSWHRSGFFLRRLPGGEVTLVCFGAIEKVERRIKEFTAKRTWTAAVLEPHVLFDIILESLFLEVDDTLWKMNRVFGPFEHVSLRSCAGSDGGRTDT